MTAFPAPTLNIWKSACRRSRPPAAPARRRTEDRRAPTCGPQLPEPGSPRAAAHPTQHASGLYGGPGLGKAVLEVGLLSQPGEILPDHLPLRDLWRPAKRPKLRDIREDVARISDAVEARELRFNAGAGG